MKVRDLMERLSRLDPDLPVLMQQSEEPLGDYEVLDVDSEVRLPDGTMHPAQSADHCDGHRDFYLYPDHDELT